jgi:hypothetical protein
MKNPKGGSSPKTARPSKALPSPEPPFEVTAPRYSDEWMEQINTLHEIQALDEVLAERASQSPQKTSSNAASASEKPKPAKA